jgi:hypothetical protein
MTDYDNTKKLSGIPPWPGAFTHQERTHHVEIISPFARSRRRSPARAPRSCRRSSHRSNGLRQHRAHHRRLEPRRTEVARAQRIVELLSDRVVRIGWHENFDRERAARFIENMRTYDEEDGADPRFQEILEWAYDHGQSLDWLFAADLVSVIVRPAAGPVLLGFDECAQRESRIGDSGCDRAF